MARTRTVDEFQSGGDVGLAVDVPRSGEELVAVRRRRRAREELARRLTLWLDKVPPAERRCGMCGCQEDRACDDQACVGTCFWIAPSLCSVCAMRLGAVCWQGLALAEEIGI